MGKLTAGKVKGIKATGKRQSFYDYTTWIMLIMQLFIHFPG